MTFAQFCAAHGLLIRYLTPSAKVRRCPTTCAPNEQKGWYLYDGRFGACGIWRGLDNGAQVYKPGKDAEPQHLTQADFDAIAKRLEAERAALAQRYATAAAKAARMLAGAEMRSHAYLARKGFPELLAPCLMDGKVLLVTMWRGRKLVSLQSIAEDGKKLFLSGGEAKGSVHQIGDVGVAILCEGFCTGLSVAAAIKASKMRAHVVICFSATNMVHVAERYQDARVIADNDESRTGEIAAQKTGLRYFMPPVLGQDFNDMHRTQGLFAASQRIRELLLTK